MSPRLYRRGDRGFQYNETRSVAKGQDERMIVVDGAPSYRRARRSGTGSHSRKAIGGRSPLLQKGAAIGPRGGVRERRSGDGAPSYRRARRSGAGRRSRKTVGGRSPLLQKGAAIGRGEAFAKDGRGTEPPPTEGRGDRARGGVRERRSGDGAPSYRRARRSGAGRRSRKTVGGRSPLLQKGAAIGRGEAFAKDGRGTEPPPTEGRGDRARGGVRERRSGGGAPSYRRARRSGAGRRSRKTVGGRSPLLQKGAAIGRGEAFAKGGRGTEPPRAAFRGRLPTCPE